MKLKSITYSITYSIIMIAGAVIGGCGAEPPPDSGSGDPEAPAVPAAPSGLTATATSDSAIQLAWTEKSTSQTGFSVERAAASAGPFSPIATAPATATGYTDHGLVPSTAYYYRVKATGAAGDSAYTSVAMATTQASQGQICTPSGTRCVAGNISAVQTCNAAGTAWTQTSCPAFSLCSNLQCRPVCDLTSAPANPTLCVVPNHDGVNNGEWLYWSDSRLASPANATGGTRTQGGTTAPVLTSAEAWPYAWSISSVDAAFAAFKLSQFAPPRSQRLAFRAKRAGTVGTVTNNFLVGVFNGQSTLISKCQFGPVPFSYATTSCFNGSPFGGELSYDGSTNTMLLTITGDGAGGLPDLLDVNWFALSVEP